MRATSVSTYKPGAASCFGHSSWLWLVYYVRAMSLLPPREQAEAGKHSKALGQEAAHLRRLGLGDDDITMRMNHR